MAFADDDVEEQSPAFAEGKLAFEAGVTYDDCPHDFGTDEYACWRQGWQAGLSKEFS